MAKPVNHVFPGYAPDRPDRNTRLKERLDAFYQCIWRLSEHLEDAEYSIKALEDRLKKLERLELCGNGERG